jgi:ribosomal protein S18 acetylase RimI-like enzyme
MEAEVKIREMQSSDIPRVAEVLGRAFATNPIHLAIYRDKPMIAHRMQITFETALKYGPGKCFVSELGGQIVGAMRIIEWPDCQGTSLKVMPSVLRAAGGLGPLVREIEHIRAWKKHHPRQLHWHLGSIGVAPEIQHKGVGSHLMRLYCDLVDKDGIHGYLETDRPENVPFYERFGFKVAEEETVVGIRNWFMLRPAKSDK